MSYVMVAAGAVWRHSASRFLAVGAVCLVLTLAIIFSAKASLGLADVPANAAGYAAGLVCSFFLNKRWTFDHQGDVWPTLLRFAGVFVAAYGLNILTVLAAIQMGSNDYLAHLAGVPMYTMVSYTGYRWFVFTPHGTTNDTHRRASSVDLIPWRWLALTTAVAGVMLGFRLGSTPISLWDESRVANNALEMAQSGLSLVTTFDGAPDHWNTKPPLLIWLMSLSIRVLGANEWAVRLPSAIAAAATAWLMVIFCSVRLQKPGLGFVSFLLLFTMQGYMVTHGARAGDYDAMLTLFTTLYVMAGYLYFHGRVEDRNEWLAACVVGIALAFMTKTIQGLIFLPALLLYAALLRRLPTMLRSPAVHVGAAFVLLVCGGYYLAREQADPGYFDAAWNNDLLGRFSTVLHGFKDSAWYYVLQYERSLWVIPGLLAAAWLALRAEGEPRRMARYLGLLGVFYVAVISLSKTKLPWYVMPVYPFVSILAALGLDRFFQVTALRNAWSPAVLQSKQKWSTALLVFVTAANGVIYADWQSQPSTLHEYDHYSLFLRGTALQEARIKKLLVLHPGYPSPGYPKPDYRYYAAPTEFYVKALRQDGISVVVQKPTEPIEGVFDAALVCGSTWKSGAGRQPSWPLISEDGRCGLYKLTTASRVADK
ncbi:MAG: GtrA family protein [Rhizobacter sp.]